MLRQEIMDFREQEVLDTAARLFGLARGDLSLVPGYEGCANVVCEGKRAAEPCILRISLRPDRTVGLHGSQGFERRFLRFLELGNGIRERDLLNWDRYPCMHGLLLVLLFLASYGRHQEHGKRWLE